MKEWKNTTLDGDTICITCQNVCCGGCSWSEECRPVDGWVAKKNNNGFYVSYCPQYIPDDEKRGRPASFDADGLYMMMTALVHKMREDYEWGFGDFHTRAENRQAIERFLRSRYGMTILQITEPDYIIEDLRRRAKRHDTMIAKVGK